METLSMLVGAEAVLILFLLAVWILEIFARRRSDRLAQDAMDYGDRQEEKMQDMQKIHEQLLSRPVVTTLSPEGIHNLAHAISEHLEGVAIVSPRKPN